MGSTNVKIVLGSHSIAWDVAGVNIITILSTGSLNEMVNSSSKVVSLMSDLSYTSVMMAKNVLHSKIGGICLKETNWKTSLSLKIYDPCWDPSSSLRKTPWSSSTSPEFIASRPKTVFTFRVLNNFLLDNLECGTSAMNYSSKLQRMTSSMFPHLVPVMIYLLHLKDIILTRHLWRQLKTMKLHGFGHHSNALNAGDLALFCPTCPQPGINISLSGNETLDDCKYTRSFVMDSNFKAEHLHPIKPFDEVWLADGLGFMVGKDRYKAHLAEAADTLEKLSCNNHRAVNQANVAQHKLESMGIGGGLLVPAMAAQHNIEGITRAVTFYDINCQYNKHLHLQVDQSQFLEMVPELTIIPGIGLWHVHGHQDSCYVRYVSNFIEGIGWIHGEIMETLWARLNLISPAAWGMTLCHKYKQAKNCIAESEKAFDRLDEAAPTNLKTEWLANERIAQSGRINDPTVMDVYEINIKKALSKKEIELRLLEQGNAHNAAPSQRSVATWISMGLAIKEAQIALLIEV
ncbi:uncharacterized protein EDB93DRAFT_1102429 [Suillus bovinus]|uniref:uncharacterized protein n=1 Tax=Suillus bovinus TaxID=48563 RepID=UPI001B87110A|nr:uncharacterized protein EDB93DRAFT_1102429 [Suillus bovinus]KAG2154298.1 hypothetical protein EDB93DRAFT_1102429 [Suillus bovinus]